MSDSQQPISSNPEAGDKSAGPSGNRRRGRRGGRGRRKTFAPRPGESASGPAAPPKTPAPDEPTSEPVAQPHSEIERVPSLEARPPASRPPEPRPLLERVQRLTERVAHAHFEPAHRGSAISQAIDEVMEIVEALKRAVDQMEEVLELVEMAERQKLTDEREIDSLRRALRQLHDRPRDPRDQRGPRDSRDSRSGPERSERRDARPSRESNESREPREPRPVAEGDEPEAGEAETYSVD